MRDTFNSPQAAVSAWGELLFIFLKTRQ